MGPYDKMTATSGSQSGQGLGKREGEGSSGMSTCDLSAKPATRGSLPQMFPFSGKVSNQLLPSNSTSSMAATTFPAGRL